MRLKLLLKK